MATDYSVIGKRIKKSRMQQSVYMMASSLKVNLKAMFMYSLNQQGLNQTMRKRYSMSGEEKNFLYPVMICIRIGN